MKVVAGVLLGLMGLLGMSGSSSLNTPTSPFILLHHHDSLYTLNDWRLPYPVYRFCTGDLTGDSIPEAMVGVVKPTRYHPEPARRLFIFKLVNGKARPLWMGSKLGGILCDFRYVDGRIRSLEATTDDRYVVAEYRWEDFGLTFDHFVLKNVPLEEAQQFFYQ
jgi:hypothetical protein